MVTPWPVSARPQSSGALMRAMFGCTGPAAAGTIDEVSGVTLATFGFARRAAITGGVAVRAKPFRIHRGVIRVTAPDLRQLPSWALKARRSASARARRRRMTSRRRSCRVPAMPPRLACEARVTITFSGALAVAAPAGATAPAAPAIPSATAAEAAVARTTRRRLTSAP